MKKVLLVCALSASLFSCSLLQRSDYAEEDPGVRDLEPGQEAPLFDASGNELSGNRNDSEVARLNTRISALETKLDVLSASMERVQAQRSQPVIEAKVEPQHGLAAPVEEPQEIQEPLHPPQVSAAPAKPVVAPIAIGDSKSSTSGAEKEFRAAMELFQNGQNAEAASQFALMAQSFSSHLLAGHALYWAGEANARAQQWALAIENWSLLERKYPRSAYLPEALAGLAKAHEMQGDAAKGKTYRTLLLQSFPKSPVALRAEPESSPKIQATHRSSIGAPAATAVDEEQAPPFEGSASDTSEEETQ